MHSLSAISGSTFRFYNHFCTRCLRVSNNTGNYLAQVRPLCDNIKDDYHKVVDKNSKLIVTTVKSLRADMLLKAGLGLARNKIDPLFYQSKILLNGESMSKKGVFLKEGDEIDLIKGTNDKNPNYITVSRVEVLETNEKDNNVQVKLRICKNLTVDNSGKA